MGHIVGCGPGHAALQHSDLHAASTGPARANLAPLAQNLAPLAQPGPAKVDLCVRPGRLWFGPCHPWTLRSMRST
ncbi:hypothetical protein BN11_1760003 [Nostocoides australiense Ben110]|uniref:Uncharacterized protein n=1 Tax=Nostocoides australiense Ben110 TaxID=1193182 RepID=W6JV84_9MICO|nr:hypothetical protein BN11_1760003 [Tetrasphaera australiensis Ben110]